MPLPSDPLLSQQWHLINTTPGLLDLNVAGVWNPTEGPAYTGAGTWTVVIDDGFDYTHSDLAPNYHTELDFDFDGANDYDPFGLSSDAHGTAVTGIIGAAANGTGAVGVAYNTELVGYRVEGLISDAWLGSIAEAITAAAVNALGDVVNISQGIANDRNSEFGNGYTASRFDDIETAINTAVDQGRGGLGTVIVKSAGNSRGSSVGSSNDYDVNADDWTNDTRQVVVAAVDQNGFVSNYSSYGAAVLVSGFGTPGEVVTTDRTGAAGYDSGDFTSSFNGTSSAAPMVTGVVSLMLEANDALGWRDVQTILANTARHVGSAVGGAASGSEFFQWGWNASNTWNGGGMHFSNDYGYGLVDALAAVRLAETWLLGNQSAQVSTNEFTNTMDMLNSATVIPDGNAIGTTFTGSAGFDDIVERVTVTLTFSTTFMGDVEIYVTSPDGTTSILIRDQASGLDFNGTWTFETQAFRGERAAGQWSVRVVDDASGDTLTVSDIVVTTYGLALSSDRYVYTNEYSDYFATGNHTNAVVDSNGGNDDVVNASAVTTGSNIRLDGVAGLIDGVSTTFTNIEHAVGGDGFDTIIGNSVGNQLYGMRGADALVGQAGNDTLDGGTNNDTLNGGEGADSLIGGDGRDMASYAGATAGVRADLIDAGTNSGEAAGDSFSSIEDLLGSNFADTLAGDNGINRLSGGGGGDNLFAREGADSLYGGDGNDTLTGGSGADRLDGGAGTRDRAQYTDASYGVRADLANAASNTGFAAGDTFFGIEDINGSNYADTLAGDAGANMLWGGGGHDNLFSREGADSLYGGDGNDTLTGGAGADRLDGGAGTRDRAQYTDATAGVRADLLSPGSNTGFAAGDTYVGIEDLNGSNFADTLLGDAGVNMIWGGTGNDLLYSREGADSLYGGDGNDTLTGGAGADRLDGGAGTRDRAQYTDATAGVRADLLSPGSNTGFAAGDTYVGIEDLNGSNFADTLLGDAGVNMIWGGTGNDLLYSREGADSLYGGDGNDTLTGGAGADRLDGGAGTRDRAQYTDATAGLRADLQSAGTNTGFAAGDTFVGIEDLNGSNFADTLLGDSGANMIWGGTGNDILYGRAGADTLNGGDGSDTLGGNEGNDVLTGGAGADFFVFDRALGASNVDRISDFLAADDTIRLEDAVFTAIGLGALAGSAFTIGAAASTAAHRIIYNQGTGQIFYDADGAGGGAAVLFATLVPGTSLSASDFTVI
ncbi:S8 family serine peptidase [Xinfangfangia pollutisoli]|uniref:S8 family serine peptidase n=1 Tax=Xinfangfangia pollutisoli TaxID=2865960 RepID=UPI001CD6C874|nr:S8 family serine peptidase [Xinfangfangia pollutisoli]